jgi:hypothetical protein
MESKTRFECPPEHLASLATDLPAVTNVLIIGWRAAAPHAVRLLQGNGDPQQGLSPGYALGVVSWQQEGIAELEGNLGEVWRRGRLRVQEPNGFTGFTSLIRTHLADLLAPARGSERYAHEPSHRSSGETMR